MPLGATLITFSPGTTIHAADMNANFAAINGVGSLSIPFITFFADGGLISSDGLGNLLWNGGLGKSSSVYNDWIDATTQTVFFKATQAAINFQIGASTPVSINSGGWVIASGNKLTFVVGSIARVSTFTGGGSGTFNHGNGGTPDVVLPMTSVSGSQHTAISSITSTQVHVTVDGALAFWAHAVAF
jgi:hypothetical protein